MFKEVEKTADEITADILREIPSSYQKSVGFPIWDYARAIAIGGLIKVYDLLKYVCSFGDINNFEYDDLVKFVYQRRGIVANKATFATGSLTVTGNGTIKAGDLFQTESGLQFEAIETRTILETGTIAIQCKEAGAVGNVPPRTINVIPISIAGIASVVNDAELSGGYDKESKESIIERYLEDIQQPITSNNKNHYKKWAKEVAGVGDAKIKSLWDGDNTVKVVIINTNNEIADNSLVNEVQKYIDPFGYKVIKTNGDVGFVQNYNESEVVEAGEIVYSDYGLSSILTTAQENEFSFESDKKYGWGHGNGEADCGAYVTVESAQAKEINIVVDVVLQAGVDLETATNNIQASIDEYLKSTVFKDSYISYARIGSSILKADGVLDYDESSFLVNDAKDNILLTDSDELVEIAVLKELNVEVKE